MKHADEAPRSTRHVERYLSRVEQLDNQTYLALEVYTVVTDDIRAATTVSRPVVRDAVFQSELDDAILAALRRLPGASPAIRLTGGRAWTVTWDGIVRPC